MTQPKIKTDIEARVQDTGDTMTGSLVINDKDSETSIALFSYNNIGILQAYKNNNWNQRRSLVINPKESSPTLDNALVLGVLDDASWKEYNILHTGNKSLITPNDIGAVNGKNSYLITSFSELNLSESSISSIRQIVEAMPVLSIGFFAITPQLTCAPKTSYGVLKIYKQNNNYASCEVSYSDNSETYKGYINTGSGAGVYWSGWKKVAIFDENNALSANNYTNQSTIPMGGIKIHDIRNVTVNPGAFGSYVANFYFDQAANGYWKTVLNTTGWTAGSYASHELAFNSDVGTTTEDYSSLYHRTGVNNTWTSWYKILDEKNYSNFLNGKFLPITGGTMTGQIKINKAGSSWIGVIEYPEVNYIYADHSGGTSSVYHSMLALRYANHTFSIGGERASEQFGIYAYNNTRTVNGQDAGLYVASDLNFYCSTKLYGAVWNDYAEYRTADSIEPGRVVIEHESGSMKLSTERLQPGAEIVSDTFGFAIGETEESKTPIAVSGRVLAYPYEDRYSYPLGSAVCSGPNGTISLMTREEIREYPERIIGTVSEIPEYEEWGTGKVKVNGRIWIRIK